MEAWTSTSLRRVKSCHPDEAVCWGGGKSRVVYALHVPKCSPNPMHNRAECVAAQSRKGGSINTPMFKAWNWELWASVNLLECCLTHNMPCMCLNSTCDFCCMHTLTLPTAHHSRKFLRRGDAVHNYHTSRVTAIFITLLHLLEKSFMTLIEESGKICWVLTTPSQFYAILFLIVCGPGATGSG